MNANDHEDRQDRARLSRERRAELAGYKLCINGGSHGAATSGKLCDWCRAVHKHGVETVIANMLKEHSAPPMPPGYRYRPRSVRATS